MLIVVVGCWAGLWGQGSGGGGPAHVQTGYLQTPSYTQQRS